MKEIDRDNLTPMMKQYLDLKSEYPDSILMFRLGDFYEMFFEDAEIATRELDIVLTSRSGGTADKVPMCGVPYHVAEGYINRLVNKGYKVAICDQLEDPKASKGIVKRGVTRVVTPGTNLNYDANDKSSNYLASLFVSDNVFSLSYLDYSTGEMFLVNKNENYNLPNSLLKNQLLTLQVKEIVVNNSDDEIIDYLNSTNILVNIKNNSLNGLKEHSIIDELELIDIDRKSLIADEESLGSIHQMMEYLDETQFGYIEHIRSLTYVNFDEYMILDKHSLISLDVFSDDPNRLDGTLFKLLDKTRTSMGSRMLRYILEHPLKSKSEILLRQNIVDDFFKNLYQLNELRSNLNKIYDIERLMVRLTGNSNSPKDLVALKNSLSVLNPIKSILLTYNNLDIASMAANLDRNNELYELISASIDDEAPLSPKEGGVIKVGYSEELDKLKSSSIDGKTWIVEYENELKKDSGIKNLKVKYNKILGYFIEVTKSNLDMVPEYFIRKQTLVGSERYFTEELKNVESKIFNSKDRIDNLEYSIYEEIRSKVLDAFDDIIETAKTIAKIDVFSNFAHISYQNDYVKPKIAIDGVMDIRNGRHPIVERNVEKFISNDTFISKDKNFIILTGPNMAGKSTYMRQIAIISIMMQIGCFVPAESAILPIFDRIFTRIGAHDNLYMGESTFMVEMKEMADIINNATKDSLLILDEVGRGTSTYDGLSIARALVDYIVGHIGAKTIFATHYHELVGMSDKYPEIKNQTMAVKEKSGDIVFLRKVIDGTSDKSYGIHVAILAGMKSAVIDSANDYLKNYMSGGNKQLEFYMPTVSEETKIVLDDKYEDIINRLSSLNVNSLTPIEALLELNRIKEKIEEIEEN